MVRQQLSSGRVAPARGLRAVIMDVDGTLYRQAPVRRAMLFRILRAHAGKPRAGLVAFRCLAAYRKAQEELRGSPAGAAPVYERQLLLACRAAGASRDIVGACVARWMEEEPLSLLRNARYPHLIEFLQAARAHGLRLAVLSDYDPVKKLEALGISEFFDVVASAQDPEIRTFKPDPSGLAVVLHRLGVHRAEAVYVGDRVEIDALAARAAGVAGIIIGQPGALAPDQCVAVRDYRELTNVICPD